MEVPEKKLEALAERGVNVDELAGKLEEAKAEGEGRERKEVEEEVVEAEAVEEVAEAAPEVQAIGAEEIAEAVSVAMSAALAPLTERLDAIEGTMKEITAKQEEQATELEMTPAASLAQMIKSSVIGSDETRLRKNSKESKDVPQESKAARGSTGIGFIDDMKAGRDWRDSI